MEGYSKREIDEARRVKEFHAAIGYPSFDDLSSIIKNNSIKDCPITTDNLRLAKEIFGESLACLKGKSVRKKASKNRQTWTPLPEEFKRHKFVTLAIDIMYVGDLMFVVTLSNDIMFGTGEHIKNRELETILPCLKEFSPFIPFEVSKSKML